MLATVLLDLASAVPTPSPSATASAVDASGQRGFFDAGIGRFLVSPGLGGLAAFLGGLLAYAAASRKSKDDREKARQDRWWETVTWVYDRALATEGGGAMPGDLALGLLEQLFDEAQTDLEVATVAGLLVIFDPQSVAENVDLDALSSEQKG